MLARSAWNRGRLSLHESDEGTLPLGPVAADGFDRAAFHCFFAEGFLFGRLGLFVDKGMTAVVVPLKVGGCGLAAKIAVDALVIDVESSLDVFGIFICDVSHKALQGGFGHEGRDNRWRRNGIFG